MALLDHGGECAHMRKCGLAQTPSCPALPCQASLRFSCLMFFFFGLLLEAKAACCEGWLVEIGMVHG